MLQALQQVIKSKVNKTVVLPETNHKQQLANLGIFSEIQHAIYIYVFLAN